ncbi:MAG: PAS domain S-box protein [Methanotrichaceae archaeon]|nr:PAS domain S-box protein [Methanotrichaceae archaeon]
MRRIAPADEDPKAKGDEDRSEGENPTYSELEWSLASLKPGDHICQIYNSFQEWRATVVPFVASGLRRGEMCLYIQGKESPGDLRELLEDEGMDPKAAEDSGQLVILDCQEAYLGDGDFDPLRTIALFISFAERAIAEGYPALRISGEMSSPFQSAPSRQRFLDYESKLDKELFDRHPCLGLCQYDRRRSDAELIRDAITTHPQLILGYRLYKNRYYIPPEDLQSPERWEREVEHRLENIRIDGEREELFGQLADKIDNILFIKDIINNKYLYISSAFERLFCMPRVALYREADYLLEAVHPEDRQLVALAMRCQKPGRINEIEYRIVRDRGEIRWMHSQAFAILNKEGRAYRLAGMISDVTAQKMADERLKRLNRVLRAFGGVTELAARENDRVGLLSKACNELVASGEYGLVWIGGLDGENVIQLARCGKGVRYLDRVTITWDEGETGQGPTGRAVRTRKTVVCRDMECDPRFKPWRKEAIAEGFASSMAVPIIHGDHLFGVLNLYSNYSAAFDQEEVELMEGVAGNLAFALWTMDEEERRKSVETALGESEERYRLVARNIPVIVYSALPDEHSTCLFASGRVEELTGYPEDRFLGDPTRWSEMIHPDDRKMVWEGVRLHRKNKAPLDQEYRIITRDGRTKWIWDKANPAFDGDGVLVRIDGFMEDITERKIAEEALQEQLHLLQQLIDAIPNPIFYKDAVGYYLGCNLAFESYIGLDRKEILGKTVFQLFPPDLAEIYHRADEELLRDQGKQIFESSVEHSDGTRHDVIFNKATFFDTDGRLAGIVGVILDISERKRSEDLLRESERRLTDIIDFLPDATFVVDDKGRVIAWNRALEAMTGVKAEEMLGKDDFEYAIPFYGERRPMLIDLVLQPQDDVERKYLKIERRDDKLVAEAYVNRMETTLWATAAILYDSDGNRMGAIESLRDISERRRAEDLLKESERRLADIIDFLPDATLVIDADGKVIAWNRATEAMTGVKAEEMLGKGDMEYAIPFYGEKRPILIDLVLLPEEEVEEKYISVERDGQMLFGESYIPQLDTILWGVAAILYDSKGNRVGAIETIRDISEHRRVEEELRMAKDGAEAASRAKSEFLANMSHEIRTPMNAVIGMASLLLGTSLDSEQKDFVETIRSSSDSLLSIINDILDFSKIEERKLELESRPFPIREAIEEALDVVALSASEKGLELAYRLDELVPPVLIGDPTRIRQILVNLLGNAVKFTERGEVVVIVLPGDEKDEVHLAVSDTGIGTCSI